MKTRGGLTKTQLYSMLGAEYRWHLGHQGTLPEAYEHGFLKCLKHIKKLIKEMRYDEI